MTLKIPYAELFRPTNVEELVLTDENKQKLQYSLENYQTMPHLILYGPPGTGKTSTAQIVAKTILSQINDFNYMELNACSQRGINVIRAIDKFTSTDAFLDIGLKKAPYKIVFLDEADGLTYEAQNMLKNLMEKNAKTSRFILSCNVLAKINAALISRSRLFKFQPLNAHQMYNRVEKVCVDKQIPYTEEKIRTLCERSKGDFRKVYNNLDLCVAESANIEDPLGKITQFLLNGSLDLTEKQLHQFIVIKQKVIEDNKPDFFNSLLQRVCQLNPKIIFILLDRLAKIEGLINAGASLVLQLISWCLFYKDIVLKNKLK